MQGNDNSRDQAEQVDKWMATIRDSKTRPASADTKQLDSPDWWKPDIVDPEVERAISGFRMSKEILTALGDEQEAPAGGNAFFLPLTTILGVLPERYRQTDAPPPPANQLVRVAVDDLFEQLAKGAVKISVARLVFGVPVGFVTSLALRDADTRVSLPLKDVVVALGDRALESRTTQARRRAATDALPDLFTTAPRVANADVDAERSVQGADATLPQRGVEAAAGETASVPPSTVEPQAVTLVPEADVKPPAGPPPPQPAPAPSYPAPGTATAPPSPPFSRESRAPAPPAAVPVVTPPPPVSLTATISVAATERLNGVDFNRATREQLLTLPAVTPLVADSILAYRGAHGGFKDIFELAQVPRVGRLTFRRMTGMPFSRTGRHRREVLAGLLRVPSSSVSHLPSIVRATAAHSGLQGCLVSDSDGLLLAECGLGDEATSLSAVTPRIFGQISATMAEIGTDGVNAVSVSHNGRLLTIVAGGDIYLSVVHGTGRLTSALLKFIRRVARELAWLLSYRGYVAASDGAEARQDA
jgi:predicted regulator of Ras-like GTPase activity (Roadblock/LC7/MglB family)